MNILNVNMSIDPVTGGGTAERTFQISRSLVLLGHKCTILTTDVGSRNKPVEQSCGIDIIYLRCINKRYYIPKFSYRQIASIVAQADVIHIMGHWTLINALIYVISERKNKPYVVCPAGALPLYGRSKLIKWLYNLIVGNRIIRNASGHIAITPDEIQQFLSYDVDARKIEVISNGVNISDFGDKRTEVFRHKYRLGHYPFILFVGRLNSIKGPDLLLRAFCAIKEQLQAYHLIFAGPDGGMLAELKNMASSCGVSGRVHFLGYVGGGEKSQVYHAAQLLVIPSRQEAMSIVVLEAGAAGTPVLLTDQCGFNDVARVCGGKVVSASVDGIRAGLLEMLASADSLEAMGQNLKQYVCKHFTWEAAANDYISLYRNILANHK